MDVVQAKRIIEALLFVSGQPVSLKRLKEIIEDLPAAPTASGQAGLDPRTLRQLISQLSEEYAQAQRAIRIQEVADGFQLVTDPALSPWVKRALALPREELVSKAAMETLAIIAYRQPITKAEVELIRGVDVTATLETLLERQFVRVAGRKDTPGRPLLYGTTAEFLRHFGLKSLEDLPPMGKGAGMPTLSEPEGERRLIVQPATEPGDPAHDSPTTAPAH